MRKLVITVRWDGERYSYELGNDGQIFCDDAKDLALSLSEEGIYFGQEVATDGGTDTDLSEEFPAMSRAGLFTIPVDEQ